MTTIVKSSIAFGSIKGIAFMVQDKRPIVDDEWIEYVHFVRSQFPPGAALNVLVVTAGGSISIAQQGSAHKIVREIREQNSEKVRVAVVTSSTFAAGVTSALSFLNPVYKVFAPKEMEDALAYLNVPPGSYADIQRVIKTVQAQLGVDER